ncbi:hypothetical protein LTR53_001037 [Teratosphaeriaceae sp. CCFEE 6253]|nr:hypothetical protein LTR53_001037 [Teratosphaeriaceae sp. CCFEE 6253]
MDPHTARDLDGCGEISSKRTPPAADEDDATFPSSRSTLSTPSSPGSRDNSSSTQSTPDSVPSPSGSIANIPRYGSFVDVVPLEPKHIAPLWNATLAGNPSNMQLFRQIYGSSCDDVNTFESLILARRAMGSHTPFVAVTRTTAQPLHFMVLHRSLEPTDRPSMACARFLDSFLHTEQQLEALHLLTSYLFDDCGYDVVEVRSGRFDAAESSLHEWTLNGSLRRSLFVAEKSHVSEFYVLRREQWPAARAAAQAWFVAHAERTGCTYQAPGPNKRPRLPVRIDADLHPRNQAQRFRASVRPHARSPFESAPSTLGEQGVVQVTVAVSMMVALVVVGLGPLRAGVRRSTSNLAGTAGRRVPEAECQA